MAPELCVKDPDEILIHTFNFAKKLNPSATVATVVSITATPDGLTFANNSIVLPESVRVSTKISGGAHGTTYVATAKATTSDGETIEESGRLEVRHSTA